MLTSARLSDDTAEWGQKMLSLLFTEGKLANGNPSGLTNSKYEARQKSIRNRNPNSDQTKYIAIC